MMSDRELVQAVTGGRAGAFERLVRLHQGLCWHIVQRIVRDPDETRDLCQETFLRVHQCLHQYRFESALKTWIGRIAYSIALRHMERRRKALSSNIGGEEGQALLDGMNSGHDVAQAAEQDEMTAWLLEQMDTLAPVQRTALTLYHLEEMTIPEIARIVGAPEGTVKSHLYRARQQLRARMAEYIGEPA
ncbi:RNA polymerase sigma factor [Oleiagrimonas soli]|uniref:RNA polymerase sigma-70 factor (ECF subfamily) n=1 Tax=Oleiagrimonas soli TaxID=1543381 RepID=A0A099CSF6_9GAMM|nr:sigma-70 family RNA polymerase sigma factor [Oleiagrimonas soli]KGI76933.1 RNA polymerase subunit sigma-24 [Oleiagrimonas soli]MBB6185198.1 RNA polymerase sigma-70 factor (ECF subfamily) [Oleiagrimonas soli]